MKQDDFLTRLINNPTYIAGLTAVGNPLGKALLEGSQANRQNQLADAQLKEYERKAQEDLRQQEQQQKLPEALKDVDFSDPENAYKQLTQKGLDPQQALIIVDKMAGIQHQQGNLAVSQGQLGISQGNLDLNKQRLGLQQQQFGLQQQKLNAGQQNNGTGRKLTAAEIRLNKANLDKLNSTAKASQEQLKQLDTLEKVYKTFDKEASGVVGAGSFISSLIPKSGTEEGVLNSVQQFGENRLYNDKARGALQTIKKVNSLLLQNRIAAQKGSGPVTDILKKEIKEGLPRPDILPEARNENIRSLKQEAFKNILEQQFFTTWSKLNNRDTDGAGAAFQQLISEMPLIDENGQVNKQLLAQIPLFVQEFLSEPGNNGAEQNSDEGFENFNYNFE